MTSLHAVVPHTTLLKADAGDVKSVFGSSTTDWFAGAGQAGDAFASILNTMTTNAASSATTPSGSLLSQLTTLLQSGTSLQTIVGAIAQNVSSSVAKQLSGKLSQSDLQAVQSSIQQTITNALSPPAHAPPGTAAQEAAALAARLQTLISAVARETTKTTSGQQNEISGSVLDANSAKELPAQQQTDDASSTLDVSSLTQSLLAGVVASLQSQSASAKAPQASPSTKTGAPAARTSPATPVASATSAIASAIQGSPAPVTPVSSGTLATASQPANAPSLPSSITVANAPDVLARMLVRASGVDAAITGNVAGATSGANGATMTAAAVSARFAATLADVAANASSSSSGGQSFGSWSNHGFDTSSQTAQTTNASSNVAGAGVAGSNLTSSQVLAQAQQALPQTVDVNAVIEQMVKSMSMRTNTQGSSEIRLNLQPENLGNVTMKLTVSGTQINASVVAQNADVRNALVSNQQQLAKSLSDAGLKLTGFSVDVSGGNAGQQQQNQGQTAGFGRRYVVHELGAATSSDESAAANLGPPLDGGPGVALFSYLA